VHELGHRAGADWTDVAGCVVERIEHLSGALKTASLAWLPVSRRVPHSGPR
jgi:hypothetical protein